MIIIERMDGKDVYLLDLFNDKRISVKGSLIYDKCLDEESENDLIVYFVDLKDNFLIDERCPMILGSIFKSEEAVLMVYFDFIDKSVERDMPFLVEVIRRVISSLLWDGFESIYDIPLSYNLKAPIEEAFGYEDGE